MVEAGLPSAGRVFFKSKRHRTTRRSRVAPRLALNAGRGGKQLPAGRWSDWSRLPYRPPVLFFEERHHNTMRRRATACRPRVPHRVRVRDTSGPTCKTEGDQKVLHKFICKVVLYIRGTHPSKGARTNVIRYTHIRYMPGTAR